MKKILPIILALISFSAIAADIKISQLPLGSASTTNVNDSFPYVNSVSAITERLTLSDLVNLPAVVSTYAPLASPTFTGTIQITGTLSSGNTTLTATGTSHGLTVNGVNSHYAELIQSGSTTGDGQGLEIFAGSNSSDFALNILNSANNASLFYVRGDGQTKSYNPLIVGSGTVGTTGLSAFDIQAAGGSGINLIPADHGLNIFTTDYDNSSTGSSMIMKLGSSTGNTTGNINITNSASGSGGTLNLQTTSNGAITTGTGLTTIGGALTASVGTITLPGSDQIRGTDGLMGIGGSASTTQAILLNTNGTNTTAQYGVYDAGTISTYPSTLVAGFRTGMTLTNPGSPTTAGSTGYADFYAAGMTIPANLTISGNTYGLYLGGNTVSGAITGTKYGIYQADATASNPFEGQINANGGMAVSGSHILISPTAPTISSGFGSTPSVTTSNGTAAFNINVGTGGSATSGVIGLPTATTGWNCFCWDSTTSSATVFECKQTASATGSATIGNFSSAGVAAAWASGDNVRVSCFAL